MKIHELKLDDIALVTEFNHRVEITVGSCKSLAASIERDGMISPIIVRTLSPSRPRPKDRNQPSDKELIEKGYKYKIIAGHRRHTAVKSLGRETIDCVIKEQSSVNEALEYDINALENLERKEITGYEEALILKKYFNSMYDVEDIAERINKSPSWIRQRQTLLDMPKEIGQLLHDGKISWDDVRKLKQFAGDKNKLLAVAAQIRDTRERDGSAAGIWDSLKAKKKLPKNQERIRNVREVFALQKKIREFSREVQPNISLDSNSLITASGSSLLTLLLGWVSGNTPNGMLYEELQKFFDLLDVDTDFEDQLE